MTGKPLSIDQILALLSLHKKENVNSLVMFPNIRSKLAGSLRDDGYIEMIRTGNLGEGHWALTHKGNQLLKSLCTHYVDSGEPIPQTCARSHPHENMGPECEAITAQARVVTFCEDCGRGKFQDHRPDCPHYKPSANPMTYDRERGMQMKSGFSATYGSSQMADIMAPAEPLPGHVDLTQFEEPRTSYDAADVQHFLQQFDLLPRFELCQNQDTYIMGNKTGGEWIRYEDVEEILKPLIPRDPVSDTRRFELIRMGYGGPMTLCSLQGAHEMLNLSDDERVFVDRLIVGASHCFRTCWTIKRIQ